MLELDLLTEYTEVLSGYVASRDDKHLAAAMSLGRRLAMAGATHLDVIQVHMAALQELASSGHPSASDAARLGGLVESKLLAGHGLADYAIPRPLPKPNRRSKVPALPDTALIDASPIPSLLRQEPEGLIRHVNRAWSQLTGWALPDIAKAEPPYPWQWGPPGSAIGRLPHRSFILSRGGQRIPVRIHSQQIPWAGRELWLEQWVVLESEASDEPDEERVRRERLSAVQNFSAGLAHRFNNLLTSILGFSQMLCEEPALPERLRPDVEVIVAEAQRGARLVRGMLDLGRERRIQPRVEDVAALAQAAFDAWQADLPAAIHGSLEVPPGRFLAKVDREAFEALFLALACNAQEALAECGGGIRFALDWAVTAPGAERPPLATSRWLRLCCVDSGPGIDPEELPYALEPFRGPGMLFGKGNLGLAEAHGIAAQQGGHVYVESQVGQGTMCAAYLPV